MPAPSETDKYNPGRNPGDATWANKLNRAENTAADTAAQDQRDAFERNFGGDNYKQDAPTSGSDVVREREEQAANWVNKVNQAKDQSAKAKTKVGKRKKLLVGLGIGGGAATIVAIIMMLLPLKLEMFIQNITKHAMAVPAHAIEHRVEYLITRTIAARMLGVAYGDAAGDLVFCKSGSIACSLYKTYTTDLIEKKFDLKFTKDPNTPGLVGVESSRTSIGGKANTWRVNMNEVGPNGDINKVSKFITDNKDMRDLLKTHINERIPNDGIKGTIKRFIARRVEMRKYGVRGWIGEQFNKAKKALTLEEMRKKIREQIIRNVMGRFGDRFGILISCMGGDAIKCEKAIDSSPGGADAAKNFLGDTAELASGVEADATEGLAKAVIKKISESLFGKVSAAVVPGLNVAMGIDLVMKLVGAVDNGTIDQFVSSVVKATYITYTYGDDAGIVTNVEKLKAGDLDMDTLGALSSMFDGAEKSPLMAAENGITNTPMATLFGGATAFAAGSGTPSTVMCPGGFGQSDQPIQNGQLVCDSQKINQNLTTGLIQSPGWKPVKALEEGWNGSVGKLMDLINGVAGAVTDVVMKIPGISNALGAVADMVKGLTGDLTKSVVGWFMSSVLRIPNVGMDATGDQNYTALSGGVRVESNELMANGQDSSGGSTNGAGGQYLTPDQISAIIQDQNANTPKSSYLASLFDPFTTGSLTQQFALLMPSDGIGLIGTLLNTPASILSGLQTSSFAADSTTSVVANNPFNDIVYGYPVGSSALDADPNNYNATTCTDSATTRENSFKNVPGVPYAVYTEADPCALEKTVVGGAIGDVNPKSTDQNALKDPMTTAYDPTITTPSSAVLAAISSLSTPAVTNQINLPTPYTTVETPAYKGKSRL